MAAKKRKDEKEGQEERARRLTYIGTLATGLAHEMRSPLNAMKLNLELVKEDLAHVAPEKREAFARRVALIDREMVGLQNLLTEFLAFARPPKMQLLATDLNELIAQVLELLEPELKAKHIEVVRDFQKGLYPVGLDQHQFGRGVLLNLLKNAVEQIGEHGTVTLRTREDDERVSVSVEDNGGGVVAGKEEEIFKPFESTKEHGTGLGLSIARRIVHEHGGELTLDNHPGKGAIFTISLPKSKILEYNE